MRWNRSYQLKGEELQYKESGWGFDRDRRKTQSGLLTRPDPKTPAAAGTGTSTDLHKHRKSAFCRRTTNGTKTETLDERTGAQHVLAAVVVPRFFVFRGELLGQSEVSTFQLQLGIWKNQAQPFQTSELPPLKTQSYAILMRFGEMIAWILSRHQQVQELGTVTKHNHKDQNMLMS